MQALAVAAAPAAAAAAAAPAATVCGGGAAAPAATACGGGGAAAPFWAWAAPFCVAVAIDGDGPVCALAALRAATAGWPLRT